MKAIDRPFTQIINGTTQFVIPVFQRDYSWTESECAQLWQDILAVAADKTSRGHFLGSVVYIATGDTSAGFTRWLLIDGQQRVTTLTLLLAALRDHLSDSGWTGGEDGPTADRVDAYFLKNMQERGDRNHKLVLRRHDRATLGALLDGAEIPENASERIIENYEYFREQLAHADPDVIYKGIGKLVVVDVTLDRESDDPQLIFESLNSTGIDLSQSDLIRNFILMRLEEHDQTRLYEEYWSKIEDLFRGSEKVFDTFIRDFQALRTHASKQEKADRIYIAFRREFGAANTDPERLESLLRDLLRFARFHAMFSIGTTGITAHHAALARLRRLTDVPATLIMRLLDIHDRLGTLSDDGLGEAIGLIESYVFRRAICGEQTNGYWRNFASIAYRLSESTPLESLRVSLARQRDNYRFPDDTEFRTALETRDLYGKRICLDLLERLENDGSNEPSDVANYTIEHIMPQNERLRSEWRDMLGDDWKEIHHQWIHRLGNLTLTGYNSTYSDRPFDEKKTTPGGFNESSVRLNKYVREQESWTASEMQTRTNLLADRALTIWPPLLVEKQLIEQAEIEEKRALANRRDVGKVQMSQKAKDLFVAIRERILEIDSEIIELAEKRTVSYHAPAFFLEVLPRKHRLTLLLDLDFNEAEDPNGIASDATQWKFFFYAQHEGGVSVSIRTEADFELALPVIKQAYALASV